MDVRPESLLPAIKCSTCGQDIDIASLADHICVPPTKSTRNDAVNAPSAGRTNMKGDPAIQSYPSEVSTDPAVQQGSSFLDVHQSTGSSSLRRSGKNVPPKIDAAAANRPFLQPDAANTTPLSEYSTYSDNQGRTPVTPNTQITTPSSMLSRKPPGFPSRSPSPSSPRLASNLDSAFPPFRSKYGSPMAPPTHQNMLRPPLSPGANVLQKMNTLAVDGPFSNQRGKPANNYAQPSRERRPSHDQLTSQKQESRSQNHDRKLSEPASITSRYSAPSVDSPPRARKASQDKTARFVDSIDQFLHDVDSGSDPVPMLNPEQRSRTFPEDRKQFNASSPPPLSAAPNRTEFFPEGMPTDEPRPTTSAGVSRSKSKGRFDAFRDPAIANPFIPTNRLETIKTNQNSFTPNRPRTVTNENSPEDDPSSPWFEAPRPSPAPPMAQDRSNPNMRSRSKTMTRENGPTAVERFFNNQQTAPTLPVMALRNEDLDRSNVSHSPSASASSYASSNPSTAPTSVASLSRDASSDSMNRRKRSLSRPYRPEPLPAPSMPAALPQPLESPIDPAIQSMRSPPSDPAIQVGTIGPRSYISNSPPRERKASKPNIYDRAPPSFSQPISKGDCRGCSTPIFGKSVKAADGRLTGRYHKECFVCKTCHTQFPTAEFYVLNDAPYCGQHYHELNGSLCRKCNRGIEGQYMQTDRKEKFHLHCFSCTHCRIKLTEDYFELSGMPYCERHAFAMSRQRGPGAPTAERRRTRLMFM